MDINGYPLLSIEIHGYQMDKNVYPWILYGYPLICMDFHGFPWISMDTNGSDTFPDPKRGSAASPVPQLTNTSEQSSHFNFWLKQEENRAWLYNVCMLVVLISPFRLRITCIYSDDPIICRSLLDLRRNKGKRRELQQLQSVWRTEG